MTAAIQPLDPIAAAEAGIAGSKSLMAAVADDLSDHERWLAHYRVAEKRHARHVLLQELIYRLELLRRRLRRALRRLSLLTLRLGRHMAALTARTAIRLYGIAGDAVIASIAWLSPRAHAATVYLAKVSAAAWAWTRVKATLAAVWTERALRAATASLRRWLVATGRRGRVLARILWRKSRHGAGIASAWTAANSRAAAIVLEQKLSAAARWTAANGRILGRATIEHARRALAWTEASSRVAAASLRRNASRSAVWSAARSKQAALGSLAAYHQTYAWAALRIRRASSRGEANPVLAHRALIVRRSTALIAFEPKRAGLPALRAS